MTIARSLSAVFCLLLSYPDVVVAFVSLSRHSTQVSFDCNFDSISGKIITTGVLFRTAFKDVTMQGSSDTDCYVAVGDVRGFDRAVFETPQLCTHFGIFPRPDDEITSEEGGVTLPQGISVGVHGDQGTIATLDFYGEYADLTQTDAYSLPFQTFPVAVVGDSKGGVYVGLHDTGGMMPPPAPENEDKELRNVYEYYRMMTHPAKAEHFVSPRVVKVDMKTQESAWEVELTTTEGRSTIGNIVHIASRDLLVVAGSSNGKGSYVGAGAWSNSWDGYITLINATSGLVDDSAASQTHLAADHSLRIQSQVGRDDFILGMCNSDDSIFVVGTTTGKIKTDQNVSESSEGGGFIMMLDVDTLQIQWSQQWHGVGVEVIYCVAASTYVYVAGHVPAGVSLREDDTRIQRPAIDQDIFAALVKTADGSIQWTRQIDSRRPDHLSNIVQSQFLDMLLVGNSMDFDAGVSDIYMMSLDKPDGSNDWQGLPQDADPIRGGNSGRVSEDSSDNVVRIVDDDDNRRKVIVAATVIPCVILLVVVYISYVGRRRQPKMAEEREGHDTTRENVGDPPPSSDLGFSTASSERGVV